MDAGGVARAGGRRLRIDLQLRKLVGRMATENCLWGAPRIHGELLKLGIIVSERTVSRYLPDRLTRRSQTWRTFLANHIGNLAFVSTVTSFATGDDDVDALVLPCRPVPPSRDGWYDSNRWDWSIGLLRCNRRLLAGVSHSISFAAAHVSALARTRRPRGPSTCAGCVWVVVPYVEEIHLGERANVASGSLCGQCTRANG